MSMKTKKQPKYIQLLNTNVLLSDIVRFHMPNILKIFECSPPGRKNRTILAAILISVLSVSGKAHALDPATITAIADAAPEVLSQIGKRADGAWRFGERQIRNYHDRSQARLGNVEIKALKGNRATIQWEYYCGFRHNNKFNRRQLVKTQIFLNNKLVKEVKVPSYEQSGVGTVNLKPFIAENDLRHTLDGGADKIRMAFSVRGICHTTKNKHFNHPSYPKADGFVTVPLVNAIQKVINARTDSTPNAAKLKIKGIYTIQQKSSGRYMDAYDKKGDDFALVTRKAQNNDTQKWNISQADNTSFTIRQKSTGRYVDAYESKEDKFALVTRAAQNNDTQKWILSKTNKNTYTIRNKSTGRYVDAHEKTDMDFALVTRGAQNNQTQKWEIKKVSASRN